MTIQFEDLVRRNKCYIMYEYTYGNITLIKESYDKKILFIKTLN